MSALFKSVNGNLEQIVQWYPGHMVTAMRKLGEYLKLCDVVIEVTDARVPEIGRNHLLDSLIGLRKRVLVLNREDLADPAATAKWLAIFEKRGVPSVATDGRAQPSVKRVTERVHGLVQGMLTERRKSKTKSGIVRAIVVGLPNNGKSSIINGLLRRAAAKTEDRAGVTRQLRWFRLDDNVELMDSPGILVPKIATPEAQWKLALVGAVPRDRYDPEEIVHRFAEHFPAPSLEEYAAKRGFARKGGEIDLHNAAQSYIKTFNDGSFGRITLEQPSQEIFGE